MSEETREPQSGAGEPRSAGERLRAAREGQGLRVETAAEALGITRDAVVALEGDDYARLGAPVYVRGYLRKYASYLGLPGDELVATYDRRATPREPELKAHLAPPVARRRRGAGRVLAVLVTVVVLAILVVAGVWGWRYVRHMQKTRKIPPAAAASAAPAFSRHPGAARLAELPPAATHALADVPGSASGGASAATVAGGAAASAGPTSEPGRPQLVLRMRDTSWVEVRGSDQTRLYYDLAPAGKTLRFDGKHGVLTVYVGNAAAVSVEVDGRPFSIPAADRAGDTARFEVNLATGKHSAPAATQ